MNSDNTKRNSGNSKFPVDLNEEEEVEKRNYAVYAVILCCTANRTQEQYAWI